MSYILEALRKADAERDRDRGAVPDLHAQPVPLDAAAMAAASPARSRPWLWIVVGASVGLIGPLLWQLFGRNPADVMPDEAALPPAGITSPPLLLPPVVAAAPTVAAPAVAPLPAPAPVPAMAVPVPAPPPQADARAFAIAPPAPVAPRNTAPTAVAEKPAPAAEARKPLPAAPASAATEQPAAGAAAQGRVHAIAELPDDIRRQLPTIAVGGSIYSEEAANRFLIINGQIFHEKDKLGADLVLEQIKLKAAVLRFKGYRYEITY
ncbi:general secretion pathway protein GspB [Methylibium sp.]|uniref:general secretion pathway protein GspB n=1 Tax=Methylibium sp. TaxID=2067992 RepID=UPI003D12678C